MQEISTMLHSIVDQADHIIGTDMTGELYLKIMHVDAKQIKKLAIEAIEANRENLRILEEKMDTLEKLCQYQTDKLEEIMTVPGFYMP